MFFTGIDLHKAFVYLTTVDVNGKIIKQEKIYNDPMKILNYFWSIPGTHKAVVESTIGWYWITDLLRENGIEIILADTRALKVIAQAKVKTDKVDSQILAQLLRLAINLVAKELARIAYHVCTKKCDYDFTFKGIKLTRKKSRYWPRPVSPGTLMAS